MKKNELCGLVGRYTPAATICAPGRELAGEERDAEDERDGDGRRPRPPPAAARRSSRAASSATLLAARTSVFSQRIDGSATCRQSEPLRRTT